MKYITVKLTEDQLNYLRKLVKEDFQADYQAETPSDELAFIKRLETKLAKAKSE